MLKSCEWCGQEFHTYKRKQRCCSQTCGRTLACREAGQAGKVEMTCDTCGKTFLEYESNKSGEHVYCSRECSDEARRTERPPCLWCGEPVTEMRNVYCSHSCANKARWAGSNAQDVPFEQKLKAQQIARKAHPDEKPCENCGELKNRMVRHHPNYERPTEIVWLCENCHREVHGYPQATPKRGEHPDLATVV